MPRRRDLGIAAHVVQNLLRPWGDALVIGVAEIQVHPDILIRGREHKPNA